MTTLSGRTHTDEAKANISKNMSGALNPNFGKFGPDSPTWGTKRKRIICEHCGKDVGYNVYARAHGPKCKSAVIHLYVDSELYQQLQNA